RFDVVLAEPGLDTERSRTAAHRFAARRVDEAEVHLHVEGIVALIRGALVVEIDPIERDSGGDLDRDPLAGLFQEDAAGRVLVPLLDPVVIVRLIPELSE